jgi:hypothetical protein
MWIDHTKKKPRRGTSGKPLTFSPQFRSGNGALALELDSIR